MAKKQTGLSNRRPLAEEVERRVMLSGSSPVLYGPLIPSTTTATTPTVAASSKLKAAIKSNVKVGTPSTASGANTEGLTGSYYVNGYKQFVFTRTDPTINFVWSAGSAPDPSMVGRRFAIQWTGQIVAQYSEVYHFATIADDGVRVWVGGKLVINDWQDQWATPAAGAIRLEAGQAYDIRVDYYENGDPPGAIKLFWSSPSTPAQVVPTWAFQTASAQATPGVGVSPTAPTAPSAPVNLAATATSQTEIDLTWNDVPNETGFVIERSNDGSNWTAINAVGQGTTQFADTGLTANTTYFYRVRAFNSAGQSNPSNIATATTQPVPVSPDPSPTPPPFPVPPPDQYVYGLTNDGKVELIDTTHVGATEVGQLLFGTSAGDRDPVNGKFYYLDQNTTTPRVAVWDPATNTNTVLTTLSLPDTVMRAAFRADGTLYITAGGSSLYTINTTTGAATFVGVLRDSTGTPLAAPSGDMSFASDGSLYLDDNSAIYKVNVADLSLTYIGGDASLGNVQVSFGTDGKLYGTDQSGDLYTINLNTGLATLIGSTGISQIGDLASPAA